MPHPSAARTASPLRHASRDARGRPTRRQTAQTYSYEYYRRTRVLRPGTRDFDPDVCRAVALTHAQSSRFTVPRVAAVGGLLAVVATVAVVAWHARSAGQPPPAPGDPWAAYMHRWTRLASPPQARTGVALAWTGNELVSL